MTCGLRRAECRRARLGATSIGELESGTFRSQMRVDQAVRRDGEIAGGEKRLTLYDVYVGRTSVS